MRADFSAVMRKKLEESPIFKKAFIRIFSLSLAMAIIFSAISFNIFIYFLKTEINIFFIFFITVLVSVSIGALSGFLVFGNMFFHIKLVARELSKDEPRWDWLDKEYIESDIRVMYLTMKKLHLAVSLQSRLVSVAKIATQVAHDIRSPLVALDLAVRGIREIPKELYTLIQNATNRIHDIANNLLVEYKTSQNSSNLEGIAETYSKELIYLIIKEIISEKRIEYKDKNIQIKFSATDDVPFLFTEIKPSLFKIIISNIINNSIESIKLKGEVNVTLKEIDNLIEIQVIDNGCGIPEAVIPKITNNGFSYNKDNGNGIGLFHANENVKKMGGILSLKSELYKGTVVSILLPKATEPTWATTKIDISNAKKIIVLDDDESIHNVWRDKLSNFSELAIFSFRSTDQLKTQLLDMSDIDLFLIDYHFNNSSKTGIDIINDLKIDNRVIIVTSKFNEKIIQKECLKNKINILPKPLLQFLDKKHLSSNSKYLNKEAKFCDHNYVLVDDSQIVIDTWQLKAIEKKINFAGFTEISKFLNFIKTISKDSSIYIDYSLKNDIKGTDLAEEVFQKGFKNIYIATGYEPDYFALPHYITKVVGKEPQF